MSMLSQYQLSWHANILCACFILFINQVCHVLVSRIPKADIDEGTTKHY